MKLTILQRQAVKYHKGPLLIIAGAGTGKTTILVEKINHLIKNNFAKPHEILALTFTEKSAYEMEERVDRMLPYGYFQMWISTFHSFCDEILRQEASHIGWSSAYILQTQAESLIFLKKNLFHFSLDYFRPLGNPHKFLEGLLQHFSRLRDEDISPDEYLRWTKEKSKVKNQKLKINDVEKQKSSESEVIEYKKNLELAHAYEKYQELKIRKNVMDFGDLIYYVLQLFRQRENILKRYKDKFRYILVDEFQDTNVAQYALIKLLAPPDQNPFLTIVGDDSQSIYKFRGAAISNILQFMDEYKNAKKIILLDNFRSNQRILDSAYRLIKHNDPDTLEAKLNISKNLKSNRGKGDKKSVQFNLTKKGEEEAEYVSEEITKLQTGEYKWFDIAILVRANSHADFFVRALNRRGIPSQFLGPSILYKQPEIKELIAYIFFLTDITDSTSFYRVVTMDIFNIDKIDLAHIIAFAKKTNFSIFESIEILLSFFYKEFERKEYAHLREFLFIIKEETRKKAYLLFKMVRRHLARIHIDTAGQILYDFLESAGMLKDFSRLKNEKDEKKIISITRFFEQITSFEGTHEDASVFAFAEFLAMSMEFGESPAISKTDSVGQNAVNILTVHASKGLEFSVVFLVNVTSDRFPTRKRRETFPIPDALIKEILPEGDYHLEEERRLFYVGLTRAKDRVYMTTSRHYSEMNRPKKISPFISEALGQTIIEAVSAQKEDERKQLSIFDFGKPQLPRVSDEVSKRNSFSFSQIDTYRICPLRYKYQYSIRIPVPRNFASSFGDSIHRALQKFYDKVRSGKHPSIEQLISLYDESWIPIGYASKQHENKAKKKGQMMLFSYYRTYYQSTIQVIDLEKWFKTKITKKVFITGKMDRVDLRKDGAVEIIDYKTGKRPSDKELKNNLQLAFYALAASDQGLYNRKVDDIILTFYFLQNNEAVSLKKTADDLHEVKQIIIETACKINENAFEAKVGPWCSYCPFKINCEAWQ